MLYESPITLDSTGEPKAGKFSPLPREDILPYLDPMQEHSFDLSKYITTDNCDNNTSFKSVIHIPVSIDSTLATSDAVKSEELSPVQSDLTNTYGVTNTYMREPDTYMREADTYMREADVQDTGSEDSRSEWQISTVKAEDLAPYSPASSDASFAPLTVAESPSSSTDYPTHDGKQVGKGGRKRGVEKGTSEYVEKRARNNVAVRKSRAKAKEKQKTTENKVNILLSENEQLQKKVDLLTKELTVLKGLFINVGTAIPDRFAKLMEQ